MQGENAKKRGKAGKEWWGKRPFANYPVSAKSKINKFFKRQLHKVERQQGKKETEEI